MNCQLLNQSSKRFAKRSTVLLRLPVIGAMVRFSLVLVMSNLTCDPSVLAKKIERLEEVTQRRNRMLLEKIEVLENRIEQLEGKSLGLLITLLTVAAMSTILISTIAYYVLRHPL